MRRDPAEIGPERDHVAVTGRLGGFLVIGDHLFVGLDERLPSGLVPGRPAVSAAAAEARGAVLSARGEVKAAESALLEALELWLRVESPYEAARARLLLSRVRRADGDDDAAGLELRTACRVFGRIGAVRDARAAEVQLAAMTRAARPTLTERQLQVAELVAAGLGNADIAQRLFISRRTAEYHVRQIMMTMGFVSRAQVAAWYSADRATK